MNRVIFKTCASLILIIWCLFGTVSLLTVRNSYEFLIPFIFLLLPFLLLLFYFSLSFMMNSIGWQKIFGTIGIYMSAIILIVNVLIFARDIIR